jgi:hypothetical protein
MELGITDFTYRQQNIRLWFNVRFVQ